MMLNGVLTVSALNDCIDDFDVLLILPLRRDGRASCLLSKAPTRP